VPTVISWRAELGELPAFFDKAWEALNEHQHNHYRTAQRISR
jgi:hypothetical protein